MNTLNQKGFTLVQAVFIIVVLALLGAAMVQLIRVQTSTGVMALQGARAYHAARSGLEWGAARILEDGVVCADIKDKEINIEEFVVKISSCEEPDIKEGAQEYNVYTIKSQATFGEYGSTNYILRKVQMKVANYDVE
ncbi:MAG: hypothetical protein R6V33_04850 [Pelovirga sp.]